MKVSFHATIREVAGTGEIQIRAKTLGELLETLAKRFGGKFQNVLVKDGKLRDEVVILVNGYNISHLKGLDTELHETDDVAIFPPVSGG